MSQSAKLRKLELACLRLASDCLQLADAAQDPSVKSQFIERAKGWSNRAAWGLEHGFWGQHLH